MLTTLLTLAGIHLQESMTPGPDFLLVSTTAAQYNRKSALAAASGITAGVTVWALFVLTGLTFILNKIHPTALIVVPESFLSLLSYTLFFGKYNSILMTGIIFNLQNHTQ